MPGTKSSQIPGASFISTWELHRDAVAANDNPADPSLVLPSVDLSRAVSAFDNQIWVGVQRTAGAGTIDITLWRKENGTWAAVVPWKSEATQAGLADKATQRFTSLIAGEYKVLCTNIAGGASRKIHVAHT